MSETGEVLEIELAQKPEGSLSEEHFRRVRRPLQPLATGLVRVRVVLLSIDAANRAWMQGKVGYRSGVNPGDVMAGNGLGLVLESHSPAFSPTQLVWGDLGWREISDRAPETLRPVAPASPLSHRLSLLGVTGKTAWHGLFSIGKIEAGETVVISAAGGAVGSLAGQLAHWRGCRVVGVTSGAEKSAWAVANCGYDLVVDHRAPDFAKALRTACPQGIDVYFDNVGGSVLESVLRQMRRHGRIICCGAASQYDLAKPEGPRGVPGILAANSLRMEGFLVGDFAEQDAETEARLKDLASCGAIRVLEDIHQGLESAPTALIDLLNGRSRGKVIVQVSADP